MINLNNTQLDIVRSVLSEFVPNCEVRVFGSRCLGTAKQYSDLDLAIIGDGKIDLRVLSELNEAFEESDLPFRVDLLDWHDISPQFQAIIDTRYEVIQSKR